MQTESDLRFRNALLRVVEQRRRRAERHVADASKDLTRAVHELRRICKELRALWRIVRPLVGEETFSRENLRLRDAARGMAGARDAVVMLDTLERMRRCRRGRAARAEWREAATALREQVARAHGESLAPASVESLEPAFTGMLEAVRATHDELQKIQPGESGITWQPGVEQVYRQGRKRMKQAYASGVDADFHNWRKSTKYLFYQLRLLERMKLARPGKRVKALNSLEKLLGRDHDLVLLRERMISLAAGDHAPGALVIDDLARASERHRKLARKPGKKLFAAKPAGFIGAIAKPPRAERPEFPPAEETTED
ncbi:MAG: CHAD domain-containing protein [Candidatus Sumerlaeia bacterium]